MSLNGKMVAVASFIFILGVILEIWSVNRLASFGEQIDKLEKAQADLRLKNQILKNEIAQKTSLAQSEKYALTLGFEQAKTQYLQNPSLALNK